MRRLRLRRVFLLAVLAIGPGFTETAGKDDRRGSAGFGQLAYGLAGVIGPQQDDADIGWGG